MANNKIRPIAIHLPQFHPFKENDEWWGKGFTEWTNVTKAKPLFEGHYQPHLPADLGFYDLRLEESRIAQAEMAKEYGIYGFCYYHYWFNGKLLMQRPLEDMLKTKTPDFPFMFCWANENWSRAWDGSEKEILIQQNYNDEDDRKHIKYLIPFFLDDRYIKVDGKPVFVIYKPGELPSIERTLEIWKEETSKIGLDMYVCFMERWNANLDFKSFSEVGLDAAIDFQPLSLSLQQHLKEKTEGNRNKISFTKKVINKFNKTVRKKDYHPGMNVIDMEQYIEYDLARPMPDYKVFPGVAPSWDNTSRRKSGQLIFKNASPALYARWLAGKLDMFKPYSKDENFIFINAWNEWAEGNHLEPCQKWGRSYLEATKNALKSAI